jgi:peptide subunit release factor 1 (eRF1)
MISPEAVKQLAESKEQQCLTLYFNTGPNLNRSAFAGRFKNLVKSMNGSIPSANRGAYEKVVERVLTFLEQHKPHANSVVVFATEKGWQEFFSRVPVHDEAWWGGPNINQLLWLLNEYRPYGVLISDQEKVRFMAVRMNEFEEFKEFVTEIDTKEWRKQKLGAHNSGDQFVKGGSDVDGFDARYMEHVKGFWRGLQKPLSDIINRYHIDNLVVAGNKSLIPHFVKSLPKELSDHVVAQVNIDSFTTPTDAVKRIWPEIEAWEGRRQVGLVTQLLDAASVSQKAAVGIEAVLKYVQEGRAARLVAARGYDQEVALCAKCSFVTVGRNPGCPKCSATEVERGILSSVLPRLVARAKLPVEVVNGEAAEKLKTNGGIGVFLRF